MDIEDRYITEQIPNFDRRRLAEELAWHRREALSTFRLDEGAELGEDYGRFHARLRALEQRARELGLSENEIAEARLRVEARESRYRWLARVREPE